MHERKAAGDSKGGDAHVHLSRELVLDCSSVDDAIASLGSLFGIPGDELKATLRQCQIDWHHSFVAPEDQIVRCLGREDVHDLPRPTAIRWFHATRAPAETTFEEGLLPTLAALPKLWRWLGAVAVKAGWTTEAGWAEYEREFETSDRHFAEQFRRKRISPGWEGPFAFLIKDAALHRYDLHKDFTRIPETLEDICGDFEQKYGYPLGQAYEAATKPCLVIFTRPGDWHGAVKAALNFVHRSIVGIEQTFECNANFNAEGHAVPASWIDGVEWA
jgi:hypothetical protein